MNGAFANKNNVFTFYTSTVSARLVLGQTHIRGTFSYVGTSCLYDLSRCDARVAMIGTATPLNPITLHMEMLAYGIITIHETINSLDGALDAAPIRHH